MKNGVYLAPEAAGYDAKHDSEWGRYTRAHNSILVDGRGQVSEGKVHPKYGSDREDFARSDGAIQVFSPTRNFDFSLGDATRCYPRSLDLTEFRRHFFFVKPDYFVIFDALQRRLQQRLTIGSVTLRTRQRSMVVGYVATRTAGKPWASTWFRLRPTASRRASAPAAIRRSSSWIRMRKSTTFSSASTTPDARSSSRFSVPRTDSNWGSRPTIEKISESSEAAGVRIRHSNGSEDAVLCGYRASGNVAIGTFRLDGIGAVVRRDSSDRLISVYLASGSSVEENGTILLRSATAVNAIEAKFEGSTVEISGDRRARRVHSLRAKREHGEGHTEPRRRSRGVASSSPCAP